MISCMYERDFHELENSFFNWTGVPSFCLLDDLSTMKEITKSPINKSLALPRFIHFSNHPANG
jgi:hypothetical protein